MNIILCPRICQFMKKTQTLQGKNTDAMLTFFDLQESSV